MAIGLSGIEKAHLGAFPSPCLFPSVSQEMSGSLPLAGLRCCSGLSGFWWLQTGLGVSSNAQIGPSHRFCTLGVDVGLIQCDEKCSHKERKAACQQINTALHKQAVWRWIELCKEPELRAAIRADLGKSTLAMNRASEIVVEEVATCETVPSLVSRQCNE